MEKDLESILKCLGAYTKTYEKNEIIRDSDKIVLEIGIVVDGRAHMTKTDYDGNRTILSEVCAGKTFGESLAFAEAKNSPIVIIAAAKTTVVFISAKKVFEKCCCSCDRHETIIQNLVRLLAEKNMLLQMKNDILSQKTTREKLLLYFEYESRISKSKVINIHFSREELADFLALNASAVSRELGNMRNEGLITFKKNKFVLKKRFED